MWPYLKAHHKSHKLFLFLGIDWIHLKPICTADNGHSNELFIEADAPFDLRELLVDWVLKRERVVTGPLILELAVEHQKHPQTMTPHEVTHGNFPRSLSVFLDTLRLGSTVSSLSHYASWSSINSPRNRGGRSIIWENRLWVQSSRWVIGWTTFWKWGFGGTNLDLVRERGAIWGYPRIMSEPCARYIGGISKVQ